MNCRKKDSDGKEKLGTVDLVDISDGVLTAPNIGVDPSTFDGNLVTELTDLFSILEIIDNLVLGDINVPQVQSDWNETNNTLPSYIDNKPTIPDAVTLPAGTENQTLRYNASNELEATDFLKTFSNYVQIIRQLVINPEEYGASPTLQILPGGGVGVEINGFLAESAYHLQDGIIVHNADRTGIMINSNKDLPYKAIQMWNSSDDYTDGVPNVQFEVDANGKIRAWKHYKKASSGVTNQFNNLVSDYLGNYEKQLKNIGILKNDYLIETNSLGSGELTDCLVYPMRTNYYHCEFRIILKRLIGASAVNVFGNSGLQFQFTNFGTNEIEILGGIRYEYFYLDGANDQAVGGAFDCMNLEAAPYVIDNADMASNSTTSAENLIVEGSFTFLQATDNDTLALLIAKTTDADDYTVEKGSFVKITLKNEG
jgi:hypothetical protein